MLSWTKFEAGIKDCYACSPWGIRGSQPRRSTISTLLLICYSLHILRNLTSKHYKDLCIVSSFLKHCLLYQLPLLPLFNTNAWIRFCNIKKMLVDKANMWFARGSWIFSGYHCFGSGSTSSEALDLSQLDNSFTVSSHREIDGGGGREGVIMQSYSTSPDRAFRPSKRVRKGLQSTIISEIESG